jgi:ABC-2 type transport system ATP-binding protein
MSTPYLDEAERCARVALLHEGRTLAVDEPARLRTLIGGRILEVMAPGRADAADVARALPGVSDVQVFGERLHLTVERDSDEAVDAVVREIAHTPLAGATVRAVPPSLEDVFIATLARKEQAGA